MTAAITARRPKGHAQARALAALTARLGDALGRLKAAERADAVPDAKAILRRALSEQGLTLADHDADRLTAAQRLALLHDVRLVARAWLRREAEKAAAVLYPGEDEPAAKALLGAARKAAAKFFDDAGKFLRNAIFAGALALMGPGEPTRVEVESLNRAVAEQHAFLATFEQEVMDERKPLLPARAELYGGSVWSAAHDAQREAVAASGIFRFERRVHLGPETPKDPCPVCRDERNKGIVPIGTLRAIGDSPCKNACHCRFGWFETEDGAEYLAGRGPLHEPAFGTRGLKDGPGNPNHDALGHFASHGGVAHGPRSAYTTPYHPPGADRREAIRHATLMELNSHHRGHNVNDLRRTLHKHSRGGARFTAWVPRNELGAVMAAHEHFHGEAVAVHDSGGTGPHFDHVLISGRGVPLHPDPVMAPGHGRHKAGRTLRAAHAVLGAVEQALESGEIPPNVAKSLANTLRPWAAKRGGGRAPRPPNKPGGGGRGNPHHDAEGRFSATDAAGHAGNKPKPGRKPKPKPKPSNEAFHLPASRKDTDVKAAADKTEQHIAARIGGNWVGGVDPKNGKYLPYDAHVPAKKSPLKRDEYVEIKMRHNGEKSTMGVKDDALLRKVEHHDAAGPNQYHSVLVDVRDRAHGGAESHRYSGHDLYYKRGVADYSLSKMHKVKDLAELKRLMATPDHELPPAARGEVPKDTPHLREKAAKVGEGRARRDADGKKQERRERWKAKVRAAKLAARQEANPA